jgi:hypothetical protein
MLFIKYSNDKENKKCVTFLSVYSNIRTTAMRALAGYYGNGWSACAGAS